LTFSPSYEGLSIWTPDSRRIVFTSDRSGVVNLYIQAADGTGAVDRLTTTANPQYPSSITPDGTLVIGFENESKGERVLLFALARSDSQPRPDDTLFDGAWPEFSPDGRYVAYQSRESGRNEVYVRPFPQVDSGRWQISMAGGTRPVWARSGRELFYIDASRALTAVQVQTSGSTFSAATPSKLFDAGKYSMPFPPRHYDVSADGERFLMVKDAAGDSNEPPASMVVVEHWFEELEQLVNGK
jgi:serine/threonine-protein kinase